MIPDYSRKLEDLRQQMREQEALPKSKRRKDYQAMKRAFANEVTSHFLAKELSQDQTFMAHLPRHLNPSPLTQAGRLLFKMDLPALYSLQRILGNHIKEHENVAPATAHLHDQTNHN